MADLTAPSEIPEAPNGVLHNPSAQENIAEATVNPQDVRDEGDADGEGGDDEEFEEERHVIIDDEDDQDDFEEDEEGDEAEGVAPTPASNLTHLLLGNPDAGDDDEDDEDDDDEGDDDDYAPAPVTPVEPIAVVAPGPISRKRSRQDAADEDDDDVEEQTGKKVKA